MNTAATGGGWQYIKKAPAKIDDKWYDPHDVVAAKNLEGD
jgi:hypothetical protein